MNLDIPNNHLNNENMRWRGGGSLVTINEVFLILRLPFRYFSFVGLASFVRRLRC